ncbi:hypothetical protein [Atlantibacter hermannii]|uniref:hypothetical protein n=1 Tax=Atlantibacter hermannii TaxID=565 RepID=UPI00289B1D3A|nr:hypothetical protein [Atlantibacter hermannii]
MIIFELTKPGNFLASTDWEWAHKIEILLSNIEQAFVEANVSLNLFITEYSKNIELAKPLLKSWEEERKRRDDLENLIRQEMGLNQYDHNDALNFEVDARFKREQWGQGELPRSHSHALIFLYAKSFLYALDSIDRFLYVLSSEPGVPENLKIIHQGISAVLPHLREVRNSSHHLEDRARGLVFGKPLKLKPIDSGGIYAPNGALVLNNLHGTKFGTTMANGHFGEVDVSTESLGKIREIVQAVFDSFEWRGKKQHLPN